MHPVIKSILQNCRGLFATLFVFSFGVNLLTLAVPLFLLQVYDRVFSSRSVDTLVVLALITIACVIAMSLLDSARATLVTGIGDWLDRSMSGRLAAHLNHTKGVPGQVKQRQLYKDILSLRRLCSSQVLFPILDLPWTIIFVLVLFLLHPMLGGVTTAGIFILLGLAFFSRHYEHDATLWARDTNETAQSYLTTMIRESDTIESMGMRGNMLSRWQPMKEDALHFENLHQKRATRIAQSAKFIRTMTQVAVIAAAAWLILNNALSPGAMIASILLMRRAVTPAEQSLKVWRRFQSAKDALDRIQSFRVDTLPTESSALAGSSGFQVSRLSYPVIKGEPRLFDRVGFELQPGQSLGITGATACGKSTLAKLLVGSLVPSKGSIVYCNQDIGSLSADRRQTEVGYLAQRVELFPGTISENIAKMGEVDPVLVEQAARLVGIHDMVTGLAESYQTVVGKQGAYLSRGQIQKVGLARAIYGLPSLVVLDEPDSNLDREGRRALIRLFDHLANSNAIVIVFSNFTSTLKHLDQVYVLNKYQLKRLNESTGPRPQIELRHG